VLVQAVTASVAQNEEQGQAVQDEARLRLFANIYSNQVAHLTTGMRIGRRLLLTLYMHMSVHPRPRNTVVYTSLQQMCERTQHSQVGCWVRTSTPLGFHP
jgi:hypothetical protein